MANEEEAIAIEQAELDDESHLEELENDEDEVEEVDGQQQQKNESTGQVADQEIAKAGQAVHDNEESPEQEQPKDVQKESEQTCSEPADDDTGADHETPSQVGEDYHEDKTGADKDTKAAHTADTNTNQPAKQKVNPQPKPVTAAQLKPALAPKTQSKPAAVKQTATKQAPATKPATTKAAPQAAKPEGQQEKNGGVEPSEPAAGKPAVRAVPVKPAAPGRTGHVTSQSPTPPAEPTPVRKPSVPSQAPSRTQSQAALTAQMSKLTFSSAPNNATARPMPRDSYSHTKFDVLKISEDNNKLCKRLLEISASPGAGALTTQPPPRDSSASVNRRKREDRIAQENLAIYKRLQSVKPSTNISRGALDKHFAAQQAYGTNVRKFKARSPSPPRATASQPTDIHAATALYAAVTGIDGVSTQQPHAYEQPVEQSPKPAEECLEQEEIADTVVTEPVVPVAVEAV